MAKSKLDLSHPYFQKAISIHKEDRSFIEGLCEAQHKIEVEHTSCHRVVQPMGKKFPQCHGKIWKYDWSPTGQHAAHRKAWRMVAIVPDPNKQPYEIIAAAIYPKNEIDQLSAKQLAVIFAAVTAPFVREGAIAAAADESFRQVSNGDGQTRSLCNTCGESVGVSDDPTVLKEAQSRHQCPGSPF